MTDPALADESSLPAPSDSPALATTAFHLGSEEHKRAFCGVLLDTFDPHKPTILAWPTLSEEAQKRLTGLPFWDVAIETEGYASCRMQALADRLTDPLIKEAIALNAFEEGRHKLVIRNMLNFYGIPLQREKPYSTQGDPEWLFLRTGYGECFDSFFAFGLFKMADDSGYFPPELVEVFEPVVQEEARHILFFVNWVEYVARNKEWFPRTMFRWRCLMALAAAALARVSLAISAGHGSNSQNFVVAGGGALAVDMTTRKLLATALAENERRLSPFNPNLPRPKITPFFARIVLKLINLF
jgi:hypothetical protein